MINFEHPIKIRMKYDDMTCNKKTVTINSYFFSSSMFPVIKDE